MRYRSGLTEMLNSISSTCTCWATGARAPPDEEIEQLVIGPTVLFRVSSSLAYLVKAKWTRFLGAAPYRVSPEHVGDGSPARSPFNLNSR